MLQVKVAFRNEVDADGHIRYCYVFGDGVRAPNLRLQSRRLADAHAEE